MITRLWVFSGMPVSSQRSTFVSQIQELQVTDVALMINQNTERTFQLPADRARRIEDVCWDLEEIGVDSHLVTWLRPTEPYMTEAARLLRPLCESTGVRSLQFDVEEPWTRNVRGEAGARSALTRWWRFTDWPCCLGTTGITSRPASVKPVAELCDYALPQAYSVARDNPIYRPGVTQRRAWEIWSDLAKPIVMGLAAWNLNRHGGLSQTEAMQKAIVASEDLPDVVEVAYWSLRWILQSTIRRDFIRKASLKARFGISQRSLLPGGTRELETAWAA